MITFFTVLKSSKGDMERIQNQSIATWMHQPTDKEVLVFRDGEVPTTPQGTPLLNEVFRRAGERAYYDVLVYANADILFTGSLTLITGFIRSKLDHFLVVGQRTDIFHIDLDYQRPGEWDAVLQQEAHIHGALHPTSGIDYFIFKRDMVPEIQMPPFAVGRPAWDNWLIASCLELGYPVVDATGHILAIHQRHDFSHLCGGRKECRHGAEASENRRLAGDKLKTIEDATHHLEDLL